MASLATLQSRIDSGDIPRVILVGGDNEYLVEHAWHQIRRSLLQRWPSAQVESHPPGADLALVLDSFRTQSLFASQRLLLVPEVHAFVTRRELSSLLTRAVSDWSGARTQRKRDTAVAKFLHVLGLAGLSLEDSDAEIAEAIGQAGESSEVSELLHAARQTGRSASRGEDDAALLAEAIRAGGAPGTTLLLRTAEIPVDSAIVSLIDREGAVVESNLTREEFPNAFALALEEIGTDVGVRFEPRAIANLRERLGIDRILADKRSKEIPDLRLAVSEATRLAVSAGGGGVVHATDVEEQIAALSGGQRWEFASLVSEGKIPDAVEKLRELVAQAKREDPRIPSEILYGRFLFSLADEIRQLLGVHSFLRLEGIAASRAIGYPQFKDRVAERMGAYLKERGLARQKPHPFVLYKKMEAVRRYPEPELVQALQTLAEVELSRKSGGSAEIGLEVAVLTLGERRW